jgi:hypothetical protein
VDEVREALDLAPTVPVLECDARRRASVKEVLLCLLDEVVRRRAGQPRTAAGAG